MPEPRVSNRTIVLVAAALTIIGVILIFGGDDPTPAPSASADTATPAAGPEFVWSPGQTHQHRTPPLSTLTTPNDPEPTSHTHGFTHSAAPSATPGAGSQPEEPPADPHVHHVPSKAEAAAAPPPEFGHEFQTTVPGEQAKELVNLCWRWLLPRLESEGFAHVKLIKHGVLAVNGDNDQPVKVAVELGYSGATALGHVGVGKITTVWLEIKPNGKWNVVGFRNGPLRDE